MTVELAGKVAVITGGASGIGFAYAQRFREGGMRLVIADIEQDQLDEAVAKLGGDPKEVIGVRTDVSKLDDVEHLAAATMDHFGSVYAICNNAGVNAYGFASWEAPVATYEWVFGVNLWSVVYGIKTFVPLLLEAGEGHVANTASGAALTGLPYIAPYTATKHAVLGLSEALQRELQDQGSSIGVTVVCPGRTQSRIRTSSRLWPEHLGENMARGSRDAARLENTTLEGADDPAVLADGLWDAMTEGRFLVLPNVEMGVRLVMSRLGEVVGQQP